MINHQTRLPVLTVSRDFMEDFTNCAPPCFALGLVEVGGRETGFLAMRPDRAIPAGSMAGGFNFGHSLVGTRDCVMSQFVFEFYGVAVYQALVNPAKPTARRILEIMVSRGDYFFFAIDPGNRVTAFRSELGQESLAGMRANLPMMQEATTSDEQYERGLRAFARDPKPEGILMDWVCRDNPNYLDLRKNPVELNPVG